MASNLPPGVTESMIPGNRPEDIEWESMIDWLYYQDIRPQEVREAISKYIAKRDKK